MGHQSDNAMLPPESAKAIYLAIEMAQSAQNAQIANQNLVLQRIVDGVENIKAELHRGAIRFERQASEIKRVEALVGVLKADVDAIDEEMSKRSPTSVRVGTPRTPFPAMVYPKTDRHRAKPRDDSGTSGGDDVVRVRVNWNKLVNILVVAGLSVVGTWMTTKWLGEQDKTKTTVETKTTIETKTPPPAQP